MINILELESSLGFGGQEHRTQRVINGLDKKKFRVFYGLNQGAKSFDKSIDCHFVKFNLTKIYNLIEIVKICYFVKKHSISIICTHSGKDGNIGAIVGKICGIKVVRTRHLQTPISVPISYNLSTKVVAVSNATKKSLIQKGVKSSLIEVIHTGIDTKKYNPNFKIDIKKELNLPKDCVVVGIVAVLRNAKNHRLLIDAFSELDIKNSALIIIGDGPQEGNLRHIIKDKTNIFMLGNRADVSEFLGSMDIFVLPSNMEALGTALLEAQSCALACIGSRVGGIPEAINENKTGLLFENGDKEGLKNALKKLILDENMRKTFSQNAVKHVKESFCIEVMVEKTQRLYEKLVF